MRAPFTTDKDPYDWCAIIAVFFLALLWQRLAIPSTLYFDEIHYVPAARKMLEWARHNPEHPLFAKQVIAASIWLLGDNPLGWRLPSALLGAFGLYAFGRLVWFVSGRRAATIAATFLLATNFTWFVQSRIAMLDMVMAALGLAGLWLVAAAIRLPGQARWRLALAGVLFGLALGAKWSIAPLMALPGLLFLGWKIKDTGWRFPLARAGGAVPGMTLVEAGAWLGAMPLAVYWATFWPGFYWTGSPIDPWSPLAWHQYMLELQDSVKKLHPYRSVWYQWVGNWRAIWYLYQPVDGSAYRGVLLLGNPFTMLAGLPALVLGGLGRNAARTARCAGLCRALSRFNRVVGDHQQADPVLLPLPAARHLPDGRARAGIGRFVAAARPLALARPSRAANQRGAVRALLPDPLRCAAVLRQVQLRLVDVAG